MSNVEEYKDILAFHPGYYIADIIEDMGITQAEFATRLGTNTKTLSCLINGQANITNDLAKKLSVMMGTSEELWLNLQNTYNKKLIEIQKSKDFDEQLTIARLIDYKFFIDVVGLSNAKTTDDKIENLCKYFKVADLRVLLTPDFLISYKNNSALQEKNAVNSRAWVQTVINYAKSEETKTYNDEKLKSILPLLRGLTVQSPEVFLPRMKKLLSDCGVAFVLLPNLKGSGVNGVVKWISDDKVVLAMNSRQMDAGTFWFLFFHEMRHVLQKKTKTTFISYDEKEMISSNIQLEEDADHFAKNTLIPPSALRKFSLSENTKDQEIVRFANSIGIHPGIVVTRLQEEGLLPPHRGEKLKEQYRLTINKVAS